MLTRQLFSFCRLNRQPCIQSLSLHSNTQTKLQRLEAEQLSQNLRPLKRTSRASLLPFISYSFITLKKQPKGAQKKVLKLKKSELVHGQNVFLLYDAQKQQRSFEIVSGLFLLLFGLSLVKLYYTESQYRRDDYIVLFVVFGSFIVYQRRILKTLKKVTLDSKGNKLNISTFNLLGRGETIVQAPVEIMTGVSRATRFGGYILKGGGKSSLYKEMKFWLSKQYVTDQNTFEYVAQGRSPKIVDQYQSL